MCVQVSELEATDERRSKWSRRRAVNEESGTVDYINEGNRRFNKKIAHEFVSGVGRPRY
jgi:hypothetical protein